VLLLVALTASCGADAPSEAEGAEGAAGEDGAQLEADRGLDRARSCRSELDCHGGGACVAGKCAPCVHHADCASDVCDVYARTPYGLGRCVPEATVVYVDVRRANCATGNGSRTAPVCTITQGLALTCTKKPAVRVYPGLYLPFGVSNRTVALYGPAGEGGDAEVTEEDVGGVGVRDGAHVIIDGFVLGRHSTVGLRCQGASSVDVRRSQLLADVGTGFNATSCSVTLDRDRLSGSFRAMTLDSSSYAITNSVFSDTGTTAIVLRNSHGTFAFNTVVRNGGDSGAPTAGAIDCGTTPVLLKDTIIAENRLSVPEGSQLTGECRLRRVVVGSRDATREPGAIHLDPDLDDYRLPRDTANLACCIDHGPRRSPVHFDFDGTRRPQGPRLDLGAFEAIE